MESDDDDIEENEQMALIIEDDRLTQKVLIKGLESMNFGYRVAETVEEACRCYQDLTNLGYDIDVVFLRMFLRDRSSGMEFLKIKQKNNWLQDSLIILISAVEDQDKVKQCYNYGIHNFLRKPIDRNNFEKEKEIIAQKIEMKKLQCPFDGFKKIKELGKGAAGIVSLIQNRKTKELLALKVISIDSENDNEPREVKYMKSVKGPTIISLKETKRINNNLYIAMEYAEKGTLSERIKKVKNEGGSFSDEQILDWMTELYIGIYIIHSKEIMHRDIKTENLFLCKGDVVKIGDFGVAKSPYNAQTVVGALSYRPPEMFNSQRYSDSIDIWASGIVLYELVMLKKPFQGEDRDYVKKKVLSSSYEVFPKNVSPELKRLLNLTLNVSQKRAKAKELLSLPFISNCVDRLFKTKFQDDELYKQIKELGIFKNNQHLPNENPTRRNEYYKYFRIAMIIKFQLPRKSIYPSLFHLPLDDAVEEDNILHSDNKITPEEIKDMEEFKILKKYEYKSTTYYRVELYENENVDNLIKLPTDFEYYFTEIKDPIGVSNECLDRAFKLLFEIRKILSKTIDKKEYKSLLDEHIHEVLTSEAAFEFLCCIQKFSKIKLSLCNRVQKLVIILNIYQTMLIHHQIKSLLYRVPAHPILYYKALYSHTLLGKKFIDLVYDIDGHLCTLWDLKNIVIRRNRRPPGSLFRPAYANDPRINFIDEEYDIPTEKFMQLHCICFDPPNFPVNVRFPGFEMTNFDTEDLEKQMKEHFSMFVKSRVHFKDDLVLLPTVFKKYLSDLGGDERKIIEKVCEVYFDQEKERIVNFISIIKGITKLVYYDK